jgi:hypothetical protein
MALWFRRQKLDEMLVFPCGQKTHPHQEINSLADLAPVSIPFCIASDFA